MPPIFQRKKIFFIVLATFFRLFVGFAFAQDSPEGFGFEYVSGGGLGQLGTRDLREVLATIVNILFSFLGIISITMILYGGFTWMTSAGIPERVDRAKKIIKNALIGLVIILLSWAIIAFIISWFANRNGNGGGGPGPGGGGGGALGNGIIESVYPAPGQRDVARNTNMAVTFKEAINPLTICNAGDTLNDNNVLIYRTGEDPVNDRITQFMTVNCYTIDNKTFVFNPDGLLGNSIQNSWYSVSLGSGIEKADGRPAFGSLGGFIWSFEIGTYVDYTPPYVQKIHPRPLGTYARNVVVQIQFSEAINPVSLLDGALLPNIAVFDSGGPVAGTLHISNQYKTVEFLGSVCGINSCNETIYCLSGNENIRIDIKAATLSGDPPQAFGFPFDGVVDMANNSFDGNRDSAGQGPAAQSGNSACNLINISNNPICDPLNFGDDAFWEFNTNDQIEITPPSIDEVIPAQGTENVQLSPPVQVLFSELMMQSSLNSKNVKINQPIGFWNTHQDELNPIPPPNEKTRTFINHFPFSLITTYDAIVTSGAKDLYQNCLWPSYGPGCVGAAPFGRECCDAAVGWIVCP